MVKSCIESKVHCPTCTTCHLVCLSYNCNTMNIIATFLSIWRELWIWSIIFSFYLKYGLKMTSRSDSNNYQKHDWQNLNEYELKPSRTKPTVNLINLPQHSLRVRHGDDDGGRLAAQPRIGTEPASNESVCPGTIWKIGTVGTFSLLSRCRHPSYSK